MIAQKVSCLDFRVSLPFFFHLLRRLAASEHQVTVRSGAAGQACEMFLHSLDPRAFFGMELACMINADMVPNESMASKLQFELDLYNLFSGCARDGPVSSSPSGSENCSLCRKL